MEHTVKAMKIMESSQRYPQGDVLDERDDAGADGKLFLCRCMRGKRVGNRTAVGMPLILPWTTGDCSAVKQLKLTAF